MRKSSSVISIIIMLLTVAFIAVPKPAAAFVPVPVTEPKVWEWYAEGVTGEEISQESITTKPREWYQLKSDGLKIDGASGICYPFDEGRHGWTGEIFRLVEGAWVKLATTVGWVPTVEGKFKACAQAPAAGTYALFAYFNKPIAPVVECEYDTTDWSLSWDNDLSGQHFYASVENLPFGTYVSYILIAMSPAGSVTGAMSGNGTVGNHSPGDADFLGYNVVIGETAEYATVRIYAVGCVATLTEWFTDV